MKPTLFPASPRPQPRSSNKRHDFSARTTIVQRVRFRAGDIYHRMLDGSLRRAEPKPWSNKAERKAFIRARRASVLDCARPLALFPSVPIRVIRG